MLTLISLIFLEIGAFNWLLIGAAKFDLIAALFGAGSISARIVYIVIGLMVIWVVYVMLMRRDILNYENDFNFKNRKSKKQLKRN